MMQNRKFRLYFDLFVIFGCATIVYDVVSNSEERKIGNAIVMNPYEK